MKTLSNLLAIMILLFACSGDDEVPQLNPQEEQIPEMVQDTIDELLADGCPDTEYPVWTNSPYVLPYPINSGYTVDLSNCSGSFHSFGRPDEFAIDFNMDIGEIITASRPGVVVAIEESGEDLNQPNNLVIVKHDDDSYALYMHLTRDGALVKVGDQVQYGDEIGLSGATGLAGYPHLHLVVTQDSYKWPYKSIPITFRNTDRNENSLKSGIFYTAGPY